MPPRYPPIIHKGCENVKFRHINEMGNSKDDPIWIEDDGIFTTHELVTPGGIVEIKETWDDQANYEKEYWQTYWWYEKPWEQLKDPEDETPVNSIIEEEIS